MKNNIYRTQIRLSSSDEEIEQGAEESVWRDFYLDMSTIYGWYLPDLNEDLGPGIVVFASGDSFYLKQEPHVLKFLKENIFPI